MKKLFIWLVFILLSLSLTGISGCGGVGLENGQQFCQCKDDFKFPELIHPADSFMIKGSCRIKIPKEKIDESYNLRFYYEPPSNLYIQCDHLTLGRAVIAGGNAEQYWLWIRHKEVDAYWYGPWQDGCMDSAGRVVLDPSVVLEAMNLSYCQPEYERLGCSCKSYVFFRKLADGIEKKLWFDCCQQKLRKISFTNADGTDNMLCKIKKYFTVAEDYQLPSKLEIILYSDSDKAAIVYIDFKEDSFKVKDFSDKFRKRFFTRPDPKNTKHIYRLDSNGRMHRD